MKVVKYDGSELDLLNLYEVTDPPLQVTGPGSWKFRTISGAVDGVDVPDGMHWFSLGPGETLVLTGIIRLVRSHTQRYPREHDPEYPGVTPVGELEDPRFTEFKQWAAQLGLVDPAQLDAPAGAELPPLEEEDAEEWEIPLDRLEEDEELEQEGLVTEEVPVEDQAEALSEDRVSPEQIETVNDPAPDAPKD